MSGEGSRYRFGPRERGGALAGWRAGQILTVAVGLVVGVLILRAEPNVAGVGVAVRHPGGVRRHGHLAREWADRRPMAPGGGALGRPAPRAAEACGVWTRSPACAC